jgi:subtilase family serine protease
MRFHKSAAQLAVLALTLVPMLSHAAPKAQAKAGMPNLVVVSSNKASSTDLLIRNAGDVASGAFHVRFTFSTGAVYEAALPALAVGDEIQVMAPGTPRDGKPYTITVEVDCDQEIIEGDETDNLASLRYLC